ncbi:MAG: hypothetical protein ABL879_14435 [Devosia sp.]
MTSAQTDFRKSIEGVTLARTREVTRQIGRTHEHMLLGAFTKRPN